MERDGLERSFTAIALGVVGVVALFVVVLMLSTLTNARVSLDVRGKVLKGRVPVVFLCESARVSLHCDGSYLPSSDLRARLERMCNAIDLMGLSSVDAEQRWAIVEEFLGSPRFDKKRFYAIALVRPSGVGACSRLERILRKEWLGEGYTPIPEHWDFHVMLNAE